MRTSFYTYFSSGYGTLWLLMVGYSFISNEHVNAGEFGLYGFPIIAAIYAFYRRSADADKLARHQDTTKAEDPIKPVQ